MSCVLWNLNPEWQQGLAWIFHFLCMFEGRLETQFQDAWACTKAVMMSIVWEMVHCGDGVGGQQIREKNLRSMMTVYSLLRELRLCSRRQRSDLVQDTLESERRS